MSAVTDELIRPLYAMCRRLRQLSEEIDRYALLGTQTAPADLARWLALADEAQGLAQQCIDRIDDEIDAASQVSP